MNRTLITRYLKHSVLYTKFYSNPPIETFAKLGANLVPSDCPLNLNEMFVIFKPGLHDNVFDVVQS